MTEVPPLRAIDHISSASQANNQDGHLILLFVGPASRYWLIFTSTFHIFSRPIILHNIASVFLSLLQSLDQAQVGRPVLRQDLLTRRLGLNAGALCNVSIIYNCAMFLSIMLYAIN